MLKRLSLFFGTLLLLVILTFAAVSYHGVLANFFRVLLGAAIGFFTKLTLKQIIAGITVFIIKSSPVWARKLFFKFLFFIAPHSTRVKIRGWIREIRVLRAGLYKQYVRFRDWFKKFFKLPLPVVIAVSASVLLFFIVSSTWAGMYLIYAFDWKRIWRFISPFVRFVLGKIGWMLGRIVALFNLQFVFDRFTKYIPTDWIENLRFRRRTVVRKFARKKKEVYTNASGKIQEIRRKAPQTDSTEE